MKFLSILLFVAALIERGYNNAIPDSEDDGDVCPPPENIAPITCFKAPVTDRVTAYCTNFTNSYDIKEIFDKNPGWNLQDVWIDKCVMPFLPAQMLEDAQFQTLNITSTTLYTLFDSTPVTTPELNLYLTDVTIRRGFRWINIANASLLELGTWNMRIRSFGQDFKDYIPKGVQRLWFENTGLTSIKNQAFSQLQQLAILVLRKGSLKKVSRDMFPSTWEVRYLDLSYQKIAALPEDFFTDLPNISVFMFEGNMLTTLSEKVFTKHNVLYAFQGNPINCNCNIKWVVGTLEPSFLVGECVEPESFKGRTLGSLTDSDFRYCK